MADGKVTIETELDEKGLQKGLKNISSDVKKEGKEISSTTSSMEKGFNAVKTSVSSASSEISKSSSAFSKEKTEVSGASDSLKKHKESLDKLKTAYKDSYVATGKNSDETKKLAKQLEEASKKVDDEEQALDEAEKSAQRLCNTTKKLSDETDKAGNSSGKFASKFSAVGKGIASAGAVIGKAFVAGTAAAATGVAALASKATAAYGAYEQMAGGVSTLFGTNEMTLEEYAKSQGKAVNEVKDQYHQLEFAQNLVMDNARKAYKTAGLSMNEYMNNVTSFAAALKQSTSDETEAARVADRAMIDMSDNANKMGTNMEDIQHAYQGFAKQNYTMLDNLKLGYGGTKTEMERLVKDAAAMTDVQKDLNVTVEEGSLDFGNIINAISVMQKSLGIAGTTSKEAASTIEGSLNSMKGSWENLLTILADPDATDKDISGAINDLVQTTETYITNILPVFEKAITGVSTLINRLVPIVMKKYPVL